MSVLTDAEKNYLADQQAARITHFSAHTGATGTTGANEAAGGSYARQASNFAAAGAAGPLGSSLQPATPGVAWASASFSVNAGTYTDIGFWSALTAGTFRGGDDLSASQVLGAAGTLGPISIKVGPGA
jgi:hypothetical protein